jgi:hypothetical protein
VHNSFQKVTTFNHGSGASLAAIPNWLILPVDCPAGESVCAVVGTARNLFIRAEPSCTLPLSQLLRATGTVQNRPPVLQEADPRVSHCSLFSKNGLKTVSVGGFDLLPYLDTL